MQTIDPPKENNFQMHLSWHWKNGTRPSGERRPWEISEFVEALVAARKKVPASAPRRRSEQMGINEEETRRTVNGWLRGDHVPHDRPWGVIVEQIFFGEVLGKSLDLDRWRARFQEARKGTIHRSDGASTFINKTSGELMSLDDVSLSNQVGASLLGFSSEGHMMIVYQNDKNNQSANTLAPAGSGSLDWEDVADSKAEDFLSLIKFGAERELREECSLDVRKKDKLRIGSSVMLTGFARMLHRGGKPEFFGLARIGATAAEIKRRKPERYVDKVVESGVRPADFLNGRPSQELIRVCKAYLEKVFQIGEFRVPLSYPLEHALNLTIEVCSTEDTAVVIDRFMREPVV